MGNAEGGTLAGAVLAGLGSGCVGYAESDALVREEFSQSQDAFVEENRISNLSASVEGYFDELSLTDSNSELVSDFAKKSEGEFFTVIKCLLTKMNLTKVFSSMNLRMKSQSVRRYPVKK